jgi:uncharacterized membrane protein
MDFILPQTLNEWIGLAVMILPLALTALGFKPAVAYLKAHMRSGLFEFLRKHAYGFVAALEQDPTLKGLANEEKKQQAVIWLAIKAKSLGITLTEDEASNLVEEAVYLIKNVGLKNLKDVLDKATNPLLVQG